MDENKDQQEKISTKDNKKKEKSKTNIEAKPKIENNKNKNYYMHSFGVYFSNFFINNFGNFLFDKYK